MAYARAIGKLVVDNPHADGYVTEKGIGRDWEAAEPRDALAGFTPDIGGQYGWDYAGKFEYLDKLNAVAPLGTWSMANMAISGWTQTQGDWQEYWAARPGVTMLQFYNGGAGLYATNDYGILTSNGNYTPNLLFWVWRLPPRGDETDVPLFQIIFQGAGTGPEYALCFPAYGDAGGYHDAQTNTSGQYYTQPFLAGKPQSESYWTVIDRWDAGGSPGSSAIQGEALFEAIRIEQVADTLIVRRGDRPAWLFNGEWKSEGGNDVDFSITEGPLQIRVIGHTALFACAQISYPTTADLYPTNYFFVPSGYNATPAYRLIAHTDSGTSVLAVADDYGGGWTRPKVTLETIDNKYRAALYCVEEYRTATIGSASSSPVSTDGNANLGLLEISGRLDERWRGSQITALTKADPGQTLTEVIANSKIEVSVSVDDGVSWDAQFAGYAMGPSPDLPSGLPEVEAQIIASDIIEARLRQKVMDEHCSYEAWPEDDAVEHILNRAGVPSVLISVGAGLTDALPSGTAKGARKLKFRPDIDPVSALDTIASIRAREWGVDETGIIFWREAQEHTAGAYDYTLDEDTATIELIPERIRSERSPADFCNWLKVMVGEGVDAAAKIMVDEDSLSDATARNFIGDLWQRVEFFPDGEDVDAIATQLWDELNRFQDMISWTLWDWPTWMPDQYVRVQTSSLNIPNNSIYRIITKDWSVNQAGDFEQHFDAVFVEEGA